MSNPKLPQSPNDVLFIQSEKPDIWMIATEWERDYLDKKKLPFSFRQGRLGFVERSWKIPEGGDWIDPGYYGRFYNSESDGQIRMQDEHWEMYDYEFRKYSRDENVLVDRMMKRHSMPKHDGSKWVGGTIVRGNASKQLPDWAGWPGALATYDGGEDAAAVATQCHPFFGTITSFQPSQNKNYIFIQSSTPNRWMHGHVWEQNMVNHFVNAVHTGGTSQDYLMPFRYKTPKKEDDDSPPNISEGIMGFRSIDQKIHMYTKPWEGHIRPKDAGKYMMRDVMAFALPSHKGARKMHGDVPSNTDPGISYRQEYQESREARLRKDAEVDYDKREEKKEKQRHHHHHHHGGGGGDQRDDDDDNGEQNEKEKRLEEKTVWHQHMEQAKLSHISFKNDTFKRETTDVETVECVEIFQQIFVADRHYNEDLQRYKDRIYADKSLTNEQQRNKVSEAEHECYSQMHLAVVSSIRYEFEKLALEVHNQRDWDAVVTFANENMKGILEDNQAKVGFKALQDVRKRGGGGRQLVFPQQLPNDPKKKEQHQRQEEEKGVVALVRIWEEQERDAVEMRFQGVQVSGMTPETIEDIQYWILHNRIEVEYNDYTKKLTSEESRLRKLHQLDQLEIIKRRLDLERHNSIIQYCADMITRWQENATNAIMWNRSKKNMDEYIQSLSELQRQQYGERKQREETARKERARQHNQSTPTNHGKGGAGKGGAGKGGGGDNDFHPLPNTRDEEQAARKQREEAAQRNREERAAKTAENKRKQEEEKAKKQAAAEEKRRNDEENRKRDENFRKKGKPPSAKSIHIVALDVSCFFNN